MPEYSLREITDDDNQFLIELHNDPLVLRNVTDPTPVTLESHMRWWESIKQSKSQERLIFCINGIRAGLTKFYSIDFANKTCDLGADIHEHFRGQGHARPMWMLMLERCFDVHNLHRVALTTAEYNMIGNHLYRKIGFVEEGKKVDSLFREGMFFDQICMFMTKNDFYNLYRQNHQRET